MVQVQRILSGRSTNTGSMIGRQGGPLPPPPPPGGNCSLVICFLVRWPFVRVWVLLLLGFWLLPSSFLHGIPHVSCTIFLHHAGIPPAPPSLSGIFRSGCKCIGIHLWAVISVIDNESKIDFLLRSVASLQYGAKRAHECCSRAGSFYCWVYWCKSSHCPESGVKTTFHHFSYQ